VWTSTTLEEKDKGLYVAKADKPAQGFTAYFIEMTFPGIGKVPMKITTGVRVAPDTLPFTLPKPAHPPKSE